MLDSAAGGDGAGAFLFTGDDVFKKTSDLSGGQRNRLMLCKLVLTEPDVLIMDEPTNHLDMECIEALNLALEHYEGTLIFVSHDREFVSSLATRVVEITDQRLVDFRGTYEEYLVSQQDALKVANS